MIIKLLRAHDYKYREAKKIENSDNLPVKPF